MTKPGLVERLRDGVRRHVGDRVAVATGVDELADLEAAAASLEVAVAEDRGLEVPLAALVDALERDVAEVLSRRTGTGMGA
ncbi:hypothetical protein [Nocardioides sp.]|uniref:hypothetical protein n=1 Tax=Nocardioides sp. TaxID=35761 RepID=UPI002602C234|nr:hypothetical protein [Nocardioides sp.]MCW2735477.1 hypothetical protein [Nocardioides sp.]